MCYYVELLMPDILFMEIEGCLVAFQFLSFRKDIVGVRQHYKSTRAPVHSSLVTPYSTHCTTRYDTQGCKTILEAIPIELVRRCSARGIEIHHHNIMSKLARFDPADTKPVPANPLSLWSIPFLLIYRISHGRATVLSLLVHHLLVYEIGGIYIHERDQFHPNVSLSCGHCRCVCYRCCCCCCKRSIWSSFRWISFFAVRKRVPMFRLSREFSASRIRIRSRIDAVSAVSNGATGFDPRPSRSPRISLPLGENGERPPRPIILALSMVPDDNLRFGSVPLDFPGPAFFRVVSRSP